MDNLITEDLVIRVDRSAPACLRLDWEGSGNSESPGKILVPFFEKVLSEAKEGGFLVDMHFEELAYFNSSAIATLIHLIYAAGKASVALRIHYDPERKWQSLAFEALKRVVPMVASAERPKVEFSSIRA
jgi:hypothetical protein